MTILRENLDTALETAGWTAVCAYTDLLPEEGVCVLVDGHQIAVFRTFDGDLYATGNLDPFSGAWVLSRGIVGTRGAEPTVASPMHKQVFSLVTGRCLDDPATAVPTYPVRLSGGAVEVRVP
ncbi:nitrite reductase small subunit NirD [Planomonospora sp. ID91781]|uniref:Nitrite reductase n=3 Tax=Planomonospora TaxID=1998 RepID=A0A171DI93_9ACTN|nr:MULTISPECIES: nitrite reductase small subunit NirD [Planomonospora]MBG0823785.1 nitrite reductase small subunit NirD [Planomonospora sp. ID91781]GAT68647.1 nitrite reductase [Planomonospora sphaerica]GGK66726.1 nitrite reductase small subunit [Planomonospora parontospora]GII08531.1 nitrite reductase small subunit [Planomonospora parontospora subsp. parontospora]